MYKLTLATILLSSFTYLVTAQNGTVIKVPINTRNDVASATNPSGYVECLPNNYDNSGNTKYPILFWLHGLGRTGNGSNGDLNKLFNSQISAWLKNNDVPIIVLVPQDWNGYWGTRLENFIEWSKEEYGDMIDPNQQHVAGLSAGGYGIRDFIERNSETYRQKATLTPMSTSFIPIQFPQQAQKIIDNNQYIWFHEGNNDSGSNGPGNVRGFHKMVYASDPSRSRLTVYNGVGHSAWNEVYDGSGRNRSQISENINGAVHFVLGI